MRMAVGRRSDPLLAGIDFLTCVAVCYVAFRLRFDRDSPVPAAYVHRYQVATGALALVYCVTGRSSGLYSRRALRRGSSNLEAAFTTALACGGALILGNAVALGGRLSRAWMGLVVLGLLLAALGTREVLRRFRRALVPLGVALERYAVLGDDSAARRLRHNLTRAPGAPFRIVATLPDTLTPEELVQQLLAERLDGLVLPPGSVGLGNHLARGLSGRGIDVLVAPEFGELELRVASIAMLQGVPLLRIAGMAPKRGSQRVAPRDRTRHGVAILGTRGIPANYGGFETFAERLALHLVQRGVSATVYGRSHYATAGSLWRGIRIVTLPTVRTKHLDTVVHTLLSAIHLVLSRGPRDVVMCNAANAPVLLLLRAFRRRVVLNVDGLEWRRSKWGVAGRSWYRMGEWLSVRLASVLVTDAHEVQTYYRVRHDTDSVMIPYGADLIERHALPVPTDVPVQADRYALYVSRWEPENNPILVAQAHAACANELGLVLVGSATYDDDLDAAVRAAVADAVVLPGALFGEKYQALLCNALCYVHATEVGGTHPALVEAMGAGNVVLVLDTPENREVAAEAGVFFSDEDELTCRLRWAAALTWSEREAWQARSRSVAQRYSWDVVGDAYLRLLGADAPEK